MIFDWRGTLATTLSERQWVELAVAALDGDTGPERVLQVLAAIEAVDPNYARRDGPGVDSDAEFHRTAYFNVFADADLDQALAESLYAVESDLRHNRFADDALPVLHVLHERGIRVAVLSDIHVDVRPAFQAAGMDGLVDVFTLSYEQGVQKPNPAMFTRTLAALGTSPDRTLMVGDRSLPDGPAVEQGITTLLLPPLRSIQDRRLERVLALCGLR